MKYIILIPDGAADYPIEKLGNKTPLQIADKPNIDKITKLGRCGLFKTIPDNFATGSAVANLSILGYNPRKYFHGRGVLEAASMNVMLDKNDVALRCNIIYQENNRMKSHSAGQITSEEAKIIIEDIDKKIGTQNIKFYSGVSYRHLLVLKDSFSEDVQCFPPHDNPNEIIDKILPVGKNSQGKRTANLLRNLIFRSKPILENHPVNLERKKQGKYPANLIWPWSPGKKPEMEKFEEKFGIKGAIISAVDLLKGLGIYIGFSIINVKGATGNWATNYEGKASACIEALKKYDLVYVHVEAPDEAGHDGDLKLKIKCIEDFDKRLIKNIINNIDMNNTTIGILPDHPTPVYKRCHTTESVPFVIYKPGVDSDKVEKFDEESCKSGFYGILENEEFITTLLT
ncbi:MAG: cofactor-independent phosphoglycerate mutase [Candidatus Omnitrophica bacterium]|jgi:2,3-bisphosphoglycerate-independent phosphoglycerate mutase|nr:cofactor-independent phosphoglycerate mutase [Candidatus Omnitrophota bacterium]